MSRCFADGVEKIEAAEAGSVKISSAFEVRSNMKRRSFHIRMGDLSEEIPDLQTIHQPPERVKLV